MTIPRRALGNTGLDVSILGFGCMRLPLLSADPTDIDVPKATAMLRTAIDRGVNYVDTAYPYHSNDHAKPGKSETFVAQALRGGYREKVVLATKLPLWLVESRRDMDRILDEQLGRLETNRIDVYLAHNINVNVWQKVRDLGLREFLDAAVKDGRIGHPAFSFHDSFALFEEVIGSYDWHMAQIQYNYLDVDAQAGKRGLDLAAKKGIGVVAMEPLRGGYLIKYIPDDIGEGLKKIHPAWSLADWGLRWLWRQPEVSVVLSGMSEPEQVEENLNIAAGTEREAFGEREMAAIDTIRARFAERIQAPCTACGYCLPCPSGVAIPKVFANYNEYFLADADEVRKRAKLFHTMGVGEAEKARNCTACQVCEERCPQHIPIHEFMPKAAALLEA